MKRRNEAVTSPHGAVAQHRNPERGYSLVETLIAMAILGSVLMGILALFVFGRKNVYSGKQMTRAVAVGTRVLEDLSALTRADVERAFRLSTGTAIPPTPVALGNVPVAGKTYANSVLRLSTDTANDVDGYLARWNSLLGQQNFTGGLVSLVITPLQYRAGAPAVTTVNAPIYRIRVFVQWNEEARRRFVVLDTTKIDRTH